MEKGLSYEMLLKFNACEPAKAWFILEFFYGGMGIINSNEIPLTKIYKRCPDLGWLSWLEIKHPELYPQICEFNRNDHIRMKEDNKKTGTIMEICKKNPGTWYYRIFWDQDPKDTTISKQSFVCGIEIEKYIKETKKNIYPKFWIGDIVWSNTPSKYPGNIFTVIEKDNGEIHYKVNWREKGWTREKEEDLRLVGTYAWVAEYGKGTWSKEEPIKNSKIVMEVLRIDKAVCLRILEMDERFRASSSFVFKCKNGVQVRSHASIALYPHDSEPKIFLRGSVKSLDKEWVVATFPSNERREEFILKMKEALEDWSQNWDGWGYEIEMIKKENKVDSKSEVFSC